MSDICPNCGQVTNSSFSRLVKDACGHMKCRMCLLYEEQGCESCKKEHNNHNNNSLDYTNSSTKVSDDHNASQLKSPNLSNLVVLPLELVINKIPEDLKLSSDSHDNHSNVDKTKSGQENASKEACNMNKSNPANIKEALESKVPQLEIKDTDKDDKLPVQSENSNIVHQHVDDSEQLSITKKKKLHDRSHITVIPGDPDKYQCNVCQKIFQNKKCIHYHNACVTGIKPYQCKACEKSFVNRSHFEYHERTHTGYKPFKCNLCDKAFPQRNKLNRHMVSHSNEKHFACSKCDKKYTKKADLQSHLHIHSDSTNNKYICKSCGKAFGNITHLKRHSRAHSNERPHVCEHCKKSFKDKSLLIRHRKTHGKERPFTCAHCTRGFLTKSELRRHMTIHSDEKPFSCKFCHTVFRRKDNRNRHVRHHHTREDGILTVNPTPLKTQEMQSEKINSSKTLTKTKQSQKLKSKTKSKKVTRSNCITSKYWFCDVNSQNQINSRLDSMGNITPVIRTTGKLSNAVPVIYRPPVTRKPTENNEMPKKTFTYIEPIPLAEAVDINKRIEAKLYPESTISHNYFFHEFSDPKDNLCTQTMSMLRSSHSCNNKKSAFGLNPINTLDESLLKSPTTSVPDTPEYTTCEGESRNVICFEEKKQNNCVSTIKKHTLQGKPP